MNSLCFCVINIYCCILLDTYAFYCFKKKIRYFYGTSPPYIIPFLRTIALLGIQYFEIIFHQLNGICFRVQFAYVCFS